MILDAITSSPLNVFVSLFIGLGLVYLYYRKPSSSSSSASGSAFSSTSSRTNHSNYLRNSTWADENATFGSGSLIDNEIQRALLQIERQERDMLRQEQDEAYNRSLAADKAKKIERERESKRRVEEEQAERDRVARIEEFHNKLAKLKAEIISKIPPEPTTGDDLVKLVFKLPDGSRVKRNFRKTDKVKIIYWYVFSLKNAPLQFKLTTNFPKRDLPGRPPLPEDSLDGATTPGSNSPNCEETLDEVSLVETQIIFVHDLEA